MNPHHVRNQGFSQRYKPAKPHHPTTHERTNMQNTQQQHSVQHGGEEHDQEQLEATTQTPDQNHTTYQQQAQTPYSHQEDEMKQPFSLSDDEKNMYAAMFFGGGSNLHTAIHILLQLLLRENKSFGLLGWSGFGNGFPFLPQELNPEDMIEFIRQYYELTGKFVEGGSVVEISENVELAFNEIYEIAVKWSSLNQQISEQQRNTLKNSNQLNRQWFRRNHPGFEPSAEATHPSPTSGIGGVNLVENGLLAALGNTDEQQNYDSQ